MNSRSRLAGLLASFFPHLEIKIQIVARKGLSPCMSVDRALRGSVSALSTAVLSGHERASAVPFA